MPLDAQVFMNWDTFNHFTSNVGVQIKTVTNGPFCMGMEIHVDTYMPPDEIQFRDRTGTIILARLTNIGDKK
jgi:hypothetical protein